MQKKFKFMLIPLLFLLLIQDCYAVRAPLFEILVRGSHLMIRTTNRFNYYPYAGIRVNTPKVSIKLNSQRCVPMRNGFCMFGVSNYMPVKLRLKGKPGPVCLTVCLNGEAPVICQNYSLLILPQQPFIKIQPGSCSK